MLNTANIYGLSKAAIEREILNQNPEALIVRTGLLFGPWDTHNFVLLVLNSLSANERFPAANDVIISPTYIPHVVSASIELLIDKECGVWHLTNDGALSWKQFAIKIANKAGYDSELVGDMKAAFQKMNISARSESDFILSSQKCNLLPSLDFAINCFFRESTALPIPAIKPHGQAIPI